MLNNYLTGGTYRRLKIIIQERYPFRIPSIGKCYPFQTHKRWGGGGGGEGSPENVFRPLGPQFGLKISGGGGGIRHWLAI